MLSDADLVRAAQNGDSVSLGILLERYRASLYGRALGILGYGPQAEDAVHDTFLVVLRKIDQVREPAAVGGWLHAVLRNVCMMRLRVGQGEVLSDEMHRYVERGVEQSFLANFGCRGFCELRLEGILGSSPHTLSS